jgi:hypothetical protein
MDRADYVGVSQGGMTGMWLAANHPGRIRRLVLANSTPFIPNKPVWDELAAKARAEGMAGIARSTIESWLSDGFRAGHKDAVERLVAAMAGMAPVGYAGNTSVLRDVDLRAALASISAPTLVIGGAEDGPRGASVPVMTQGVQNGRSVILPNAAHLGYVENPAAFNDALLAHLDAPRPLPISRRSKASANGEIPRLAHAPCVLPTWPGWLHAATSAAHSSVRAGEPQVPDTPVGGAQRAADITPRREAIEQGHDCWA